MKRVLFVLALFVGGPVWAVKSPGGVNVSGRFLSGNGTTAAQAYSFTQYPGSGMYTNGGTVILGAGGSDMFAGVASTYQAYIYPPLVLNSGASVTAVSTQTIAAGNTIAANACGSTKRISSAGAVTTDTTNTFGAGTAGVVCEMKVCNVGSQNITLDRNANTKLVGGADVVLAADSCIGVSFDGVFWRQTSAVLTGT